MNRLPMLLVASVITLIAGGASAGGAQLPSASDEVRALAAQRPAEMAELSAATTKDCGPMPTSTDEARAAAGAWRVASSTVAPRPRAAEQTARMPSSTDEARALAAEATNARAMRPDVRHAEACTTSCACKKAEQHAAGSGESCRCHKRT